MSTTPQSPAHHSDEVINAHLRLEGKLSLLTLFADMLGHEDERHGVDDPVLERAAWRGIEDLTRDALTDAKTMRDEAEALYQCALSGKGR